MRSARSTWTTAETNTFLSDYIGAQGDAVDCLQKMTYNADRRGVDARSRARCSRSSTDDPDLQHR